MLSIETGSLIAWAATIAFVLIIVGGVCAFIRLVKGPSFPDRVVVLDFIGVLVVSLAALFAIVTGFSAYLDVSVAFALVAFLGTVAFARFAEKRQYRDTTTETTTDATGKAEAQEDAR